ncbi:hypothetical protein ACSSS7_005290 [Eimeria intestinalis]
MEAGRALESSPNTEEQLLQLLCCIPGCCYRNVIASGKEQAMHIAALHPQAPKATAAEGLRECADSEGVGGAAAGRGLQSGTRCRKPLFCSVLVQQRGVSENITNPLTLLPGVRGQTLLLQVLPRRLRRMKANSFCIKDSK